MFKVISVNVNGIRAAQRKGFFEWLKLIDADVICIQETKAQEEQLDPILFYPSEYHCYYFDAQKKGYSGVAIYCKQAPDKIIRGLGKIDKHSDWDLMDSEGRFIQADFGKLSVISLYLPSGSSKDERQLLKYDFMQRFTPVLKSFRRKRREYIICGDWNIAHKNIDIKNWRSNQKNSGFLPEERAWLDQLFNEVGLVDAFRVTNQQADEYTWWSNRGQAWANNVGWRIDYHIITPGLSEKVVSASIYKQQRFSDHAPLILDYNI